MQYVLHDGQKIKQGKKRTIELRIHFIFTSSVTSKTAQLPVSGIRPVYDASPFLVRHLVLSCGRAIRPGIKPFYSSDSCRFSQYTLVTGVVAADRKSVV